MNHETAGLTIHDHMHELTSEHTHREPYTTHRNGTAFVLGHAVRVPALIVQLNTATPSGTGDQGTAAGFASQPAARLDTIDARIRIDLEAARWVRDLGEDDDRATTIGTLRQLHGLYASAYRCDHTGPIRDEQTRAVTCCTQHAIEADVRRWWTQARVITGWDTPAWRPANTCPLCGRRGSLRVRLADQAAFCAECHETWGPDTIGLLADHIRNENADPRRDPRLDHLDDAG